MFKQTIVFDFDGVIHSYKSGWKGYDVIPDPPVEGIKEAIDELRDIYRIVVCSSRCSTREGKKAVMSFLSEHNIVVDEVTHEKVPAILYIDDRGHCFSGHAENLVSYIRNFKPWTRKDKCPCCEIAEDTTPSGEEIYSNISDSYEDGVLSYLVKSKDRYLMRSECIEIIDREEGIARCTGYTNTLINYCPACGRYLGN